MHRFFIDKSKINGNVVSLEQEDALHIYKVLRLREGDTIELCDGQGIDYTAKLGKVSADYVEAHIQARFQTQGEYWLFEMQ
jgi:16S rRNA (uracil1498-N3)-methyltransferase